MKVYIHIPDKNSSRIILLPCLLLVGAGAIAAEYRVTIEDMIAKAGISMDILEQECSSEMLPNLAKFCVDWKLVGFHLKVIQAEMQPLIVIIVQ